jgi:acetyl esterase/lipase
VPASDALTVRRWLDDLLPTAFAAYGDAPGITRRDVRIDTPDGGSIGARWYARGEERPGSAVVFAHGGGFVGGSVEAYDPYVAHHVLWSGVPMLSVDYRRAPDVTGETSARDVYAALAWLQSGAGPDVDPSRVAVMGDSAGGGLVVAAAILARDAGMPLARQILVFPMLDDRTAAPVSPSGSAITWSYEDNATCWRALLGDRVGSSGVTAIEAPARLDDVAGLAPAYLEVGTLDIFRDETVAYAAALLRANIEAELHVHPGVPHGYDSEELDSDFSRRWRDDRVRVLTGL